MAVYFEKENINTVDSKGEFIITLMSSLVQGESRKYYLKVPAIIKEAEQLRKEDGFSTSIVDIFKQLLTLELDANLIELFVAKDTEKKQNF